VKVLTLKPPQHPMVDFLRVTMRCALWAGMGMGKSSATLFLLVLLKMLGELTDGPILVIGPARVARDTWPDEVAKWEQFKHLRITPLTGCTPKERLGRLKRRSDIFTISYELLPWLVDHFEARWPFRTVVADEADRLKGFRTRQGGQRAQQIARVAHNFCTRWIELTGTPSPNGLKDLWGQMWYIDRGARLGTTYTAFLERWFKPSWSGRGIEPMPHAEREIHAALADVCLTIDPKDYFDLKDPLITAIKVKLPPAARKVYKQLEKDMYADLQSGTGVEVFNAAALTNKCLQLANGAIYTTYPQWEAVHDAKLEALESVLAEAGGMPVLCAYAFKSDLYRIMAAFPKSVELATTKGMAAFKAGNSPLGLAHPASMGHGIDGLQYVTNILTRFGHDWNLGTTIQMAERIGPMRQLQAGFERPVFIYDLIADGTLDEVVIDARRSKLTVQNALLRAMRRPR
jgi:SNF2 family DNA or RNA helicase